MVRLALVAVLTFVAAPAAAQTTPLHVESNGAPLEVTLVGAEGIPFTCTTPCALYANPGPWELEARGAGVRSVSQTLELGEDGATWNLRAGSSGAYVWGTLLASLGFASLGLSASFVVMALTSAPGDSYNEMMATMIGVMGGLVATGALIGGWSLIGSNLNGVDVSLAPAPGGGLATASGRF